MNCENDLMHQRARFPMVYLPRRFCQPVVIHILEKWFYITFQELASPKEPLTANADEWCSLTLCTMVAQVISSENIRLLQSHSYEFKFWLHALIDMTLKYYSAPTMRCK